MKGINIAEQAHVAIAKYPATSNGVTTLDAVNMEGYSHISMILVSGAAAGTDIVATVYASTDASATSAELVAFNYYQETTASTDVLGARVLNSTTALTLDNSATTNIFAVAEIDASELPDGHNWVNMTLTDSTNATNIICCIYVLSGARYAGPESPTVIS
jgi:hypothetical protein